MLFSSTIFLWLFLPIVLILYKLIDRKYRNYLLLIASIVFYGWGGVKYLVLIFFSIIVNYLSGLFIDRYKDRIKIKQLILILCLLINLGLLGYFKYYNFVGKIFNSLLSFEAIPFKEIILPIGISFYTFQALSYVIDLYRGNIRLQKNIFYLALYVMFFPQLIAGPIVRYADIEKEINERNITSLDVAYGIKRFIYGLSKKVIISNVLAKAVDTILAYDIHSLSTFAIWIAMIMYAFQIYYDFSGYSDMAIGLGKMFGFNFLENFNYPYISSSIQDFWRRWHISLSTWFREYIYIPLGGNRKGKIRTYVNLFIVFLTTGLWHGASFAFVFWGLWHGLFSIIERLFLGDMLKKNKFKMINHVYVWLVVIIGWVFFRLESFKLGLSALKRMFIYTPEGISILNEVMTNKVIFILIIAVLFCGIIQNLFPKLKSALYEKQKIYTFEYIILFGLLFINMMLLVSNSYNPFIYFRF